MKTQQQVRTDALAFVEKLQEVQREQLLNGVSMSLDVDVQEDCVDVSAKVYTQDTKYAYKPDNNFSWRFTNKDDNNDELARLQTKLANGLQTEEVQCEE